MRRLIIASMRGSAGKTSVIVGLGRAIEKKIGYLKPFGDRLLYRKKRLWDYDAALVANIFGLKDNPEEMSVGFDHSKLRFMYDKKSTKEKLLEMLSHIESDKDFVCIEGGRDMAHGMSVHLDAVALAKYVDATLVIVISGDEGTILDDAAFIKNHLDLEGIRFGGVIINKVHDIEDFKSTYVAGIEELGTPVLGVIPYAKELTSLSLGFLSEALFAKLIAGEEGLDRVVRNIFVGAMSTDAALRNPFFGKEDKLVITPGDRSDMILAAMEAGAVGIVLTNNIFPPSNIISMAAERKVPLLLVPTDTFQTSKQVDDLERLLTKDEPQKIELLGRLARENIDLKAVIGTGNRPGARTGA
ncbi:MAG: AAA family ATPase [Candidatus Eisenbacteria sp.]|nr:AAA family ATPase [Candidatus Eisenbacteria bacterium]